jgi:SAM-dependent methyltransferase
MRLHDFRSDSGFPCAIAKLRVRTNGLEQGELSSRPSETQAAIVALRAQNRLAWNRLAEEGSVFARVATDEECRNALGTLDGRGWLPNSVQGLDVLCLASGGGWQAILYAAAGARVTVVDLSPAMLKLDEHEASRRGLHVRLVEASMDELGPLDEAAFDIVHQPVSTCYVPNVLAVYHEVARVLRSGGLYISQHKQPASLQVTHRDDRDRYVLGIEFNHQGPLPAVPDRSYRETGSVEFLHAWGDLVGGLCRAGFTIEDLVEPLRADATASAGQIGHRGCYVPPYVRIKARRMARDAQSASPLWMP